MHATLDARHVHPLRPAEPEPETNLADPREWARDLAIIGAITGSALPLVLHASLSFALVTGLAAALGGALIGLGAPIALHRRVRRLPVVVLLGAGAGLGANWGAASALIAALATGELASMRAVHLGGTAGLIQLGVFWLPAILLRARGLPTTPARLAAVALVPAIAAYLALAC